MRREVSPVEVVDHFLARTEALDGQLHCYVSVASDSALETARRLESKLKSGEEPGALFGVPVAIKDQYTTRGIRTTAGSLTLENHVPEEDAACVERIRAADGVIIGKTNLPEFALHWRTQNYVAAETRNPWNLHRSPGGSSGGSAAAVAAGLVPVAIGSDGGGSTRLPAAFCGVVGLLPTTGVVSNYGALGRAQLFDRIGPISRDIRDADTLLTVLAGPDPRDPVCLSKDAIREGPGREDAATTLSCAWWSVKDTQGSNPDVVESIHHEALRISELGVAVHDTGLELDREYEWPFQVISSSDRYALHGSHLYDNDATRSLLTPYARDIYEAGKRWTGAEYALALEARYRWIGRLQELFTTYDFLMSPTVGFVAPKTHDDWRWIPPGICDHTQLANFCGIPAISIPCGMIDGLPIGLQIMGPAGSERRLLQVASAIEVAGLFKLGLPSLAR